MTRYSSLLFCLILILTFNPVRAQRDSQKMPGIEVKNDRRALIFQINWTNNKSSTVKFPPFHLVIGKEQMRRWENMVINEIQSNFEAFEAPFSYDISMMFPGSSEQENDANNLEKIQGSIQDVLAMVGGQADIKPDGKICITGIMDWASVGFELDDFDMSPTSGGKTTIKKHPNGSTTETTNYPDGSTKDTHKDAKGVPYFEVTKSPTTTKEYSDGSISETETKSAYSLDKDGKRIGGSTTTTETNISHDGTTVVTKKNTEIVHTDGTKTKIESTHEVNVSEGVDEKFTGVAEIDENGVTKKITWSWDYSDGSTDVLTYDPETGKIKHKHITAGEKAQSHEPEPENDLDYTPPEKNQSGVEMTTDDLTLDTDLAFCFPAEMFNVLINWNKLGAAVTDPSPIDDEEIISDAQSIAPIDPPKDEYDWTPRVRYLNILPGDGITDPPRR